MSKIMVRVIYSGLFLCYNFFTLCERIEIMTKKRIALKIVRRVGIVYSYHSGSASYRAVRRCKNYGIRTIKDSKKSVC